MWFGPTVLDHVASIFSNGSTAALVIAVKLWGRPVCWWIDESKELQD